MKVWIVLLWTPSCILPFHELFNRNGSKAVIRLRCSAGMVGYCVTQPYHDVLVVAIIKKEHISPSGLILRPWK